MQLSKRGALQASFGFFVFQLLSPDDRVFVSRAREVGRRMNFAGIIDRNNTVIGHLILVRSREAGRRPSVDDWPCRRFIKRRSATVRAAIRLIALGYTVDLSGRMRMTTAGRMLIHAGQLAG